ncbi:MAG: DNA recombination protein RmuC, partial [Micropruina sp.]|uniref:DNA recombination protein RmuC n=1 Tax=Micropruina sp. TaxID=2737536 RepID=UPI0039E2320C
EARREASEARAEAADARAEASATRAELARAGTDVERARVEAADARAAASAAQADAAEVAAQLAAAVAQRDAATQRAEELAADRESLVAQFKVLSAETLERQGKAADDTAEKRLRATELLLKPVHETLEAFRTRLGEVEQQRAVLANELANQVRNVQATGEQLRLETRALATALRKPHVRGNWGEQQLKRVVELAGMVEHCDFVTQQTTSTSAEQVIRPDLKVLLEGDRYVWVDSKVPLAAFLDANETDDEQAREHALKQFSKNVRSHVDQLSGKDYFKSDLGTPEFVVMFVPSEALAAEALSRQPDLHEYASRRNVILATPTTLIALLRAVAYGWKQVALAESAAEVFELARELYDRLGTLGGHFDKVGRMLGASVTAYNQAVGSIEGRVFPTARRLRELHVTGKELAPVKAVDAAVRPLTAPELIDDAVQVTPLIGGRPDDPEELTRPQPALDELIAGELEPPAPSRRRRTAG